MSTVAPLLGEPLPVELMNTVWADRDGVHDALATPQQVAAWLVAVTGRLEVPAGAEPGTGPLDRTWTGVRHLRDALRRLAAEATGDVRPAAASAVTGLQVAVDVLNEAAAQAPRWAALEWPGPASPPTRKVKAAGAASEAAISQIADEAIALLGSPRGSGLRACHAPGCVLYFVRHHPRREWCSPACGNRARVARHYRRHT